VPSPNAPGSQDDYLQSVSCVSTDFCMAAGYALAATTQGSQPQTLIEQWNGTSWSIDSSPNQTVAVSNLSGIVDNQLFGVSCASESSCMAVGEYVCGFCPEGFPQTLALRWDGVAWTLLSPQNPSTNRFGAPGNQSDELVGVSCPGSDECVAAGYYYDGLNDHTLVERWDGTAWSVSASPNTSDTYDNQLTAISCSSPTSCMAVGSFYNGSTVNQTGTTTQVLGMRWDGIAWALTPFPAPPGSATDTLLASVTCTGGSDCAATGVWDDAGIRFRTLVYGWNGVAWAAAVSPDPASGDNWISGVSCPDAAFCAASGYSDTGTSQGTATEVMQRAAGTWVGVPSPDPSVATFSQLLSVSCSGEGFCVAVGDANSGPPQGVNGSRPTLTLIEASSSPVPAAVPEVPAGPLLLLPALAVAGALLHRRL
jgi:hypothetical protein